MSVTDIQKFSSMKGFNLIACASDSSRLRPSFLDILKVGGLMWEKELPVRLLFELNCGQKPIKNLYENVC